MCQAARWLLLFACAAAAIVAVLVMLRQVPEIVRELRELPEVRKVEFSGNPRASRIVVHLRDWHMVPKDAAEGAGIDYQMLMDEVERVQADQLAIAAYLLARSSWNVYSEGLSPESEPDLQLRLDLLRTLENAPQLDQDARNVQRELLLTVGVPGRLVLSKSIEKVLPLEDEQALHEANPAVNPSEAKITARRQAMVDSLAESGLAIVVLGGLHDLGPLLPADVLYVRVTTRNYPE